MTLVLRFLRRKLAQAIHDGNAAAAGMYRRRINEIEEGREPS